MKKLFCLAFILTVFVNVNTFSVTKKSSASKKVHQDRHKQNL